MSQYQELAALPPLKGDGKGGFRIQIVGNCGSGKSTLATKLSIVLGIPHIHLDELFWLPGWVSTPDDEFHAKVRGALDDAMARHGGWIVDGGYERVVGGMVRAEATDVIWLDPPLVLYFPRLLLRTLVRLVHLAPPCRPGCDEKITEMFTSKGILWWCITNHAKLRSRERESRSRIGVGLESQGVKPEDAKQRRLGGWGGEAKAWLESVEHMVRVR